MGEEEGNVGGEGKYEESMRDDNEGVKVVYRTQYII